MQMILRILGAVALLAGTFYCVNAFRATFESPVLSERLPWQALWGLIGASCFVAAVNLLFPRRPKE